MILLTAIAATAGMGSAATPPLNTNRTAVLDFFSENVYGRRPDLSAFDMASSVAGRDAELPFDQHWLIAAIAPRLIVVGSAENDHWACPSGEHAGLDLARPAWGVRQDCCHYHIRPGEHDILACDWLDYMDFAKTHGW